MTARLPALILVACATIGPIAAQAPPQTKVDMVRVIGCLTPGDKPDVWFLTSATDPTVITGKEPPLPPGGSAPLAGKNRYRLIGILELNVPAYKGQTVAVSGLLIPGPEKRINLTSVRMVTPTCHASPSGSPR
jgi:hypothetical protein